MVLQGDCEVSNDPAIMFTTVLGSCISACIRDPHTRYGGMNHFLLPTSADGSDQMPLRYGAYAMEALINRILTYSGAKKEDLEVKIFGGAKVSRRLCDIGASNSEFVEDFLRREQYKILSSDIGGKKARRIVYHPVTGKVFVQHIDDALGPIAQNEQWLADQVPTQLDEAGDIELF